MTFDRESKKENDSLRFLWEVEDDATAGFIALHHATCIGGT
jgi:hypothetical protein